VAALVEWAAATEREGLRLLPPESLHVTLAFLGGRPEEEVDPIAEALRRVGSPVPALRFAEPAWLPPRRPGVLAVDLHDDDGACARLQGAVSEGLAALGVYTAEKRAFRPHVTVARVRKGARVDTEVPGIPGAGTFAAPALTLYRSHLGPKGARYDALARIPLT
jgi:RNA 2',3'-cyclic 3'-phosphodiesterase